MTESKWLSVLRFIPRTVTCWLLGHMVLEQPNLLERDGAILNVVRCDCLRCHRHWERKP